MLSCSNAGRRERGDGRPKTGVGSWESGAGILDLGFGIFWLNSNGPPLGELGIREFYRKRICAPPKTLAPVIPGNDELRMDIRP